MTTALYSPADEIHPSAVGSSGRDRVTLLQFVTVFALGGTERHLVNLSRGLDRSLFDLQLACMNRSGYFLKEFEEQSIPISEYPVHNLYGAGSVWQRLRFARELTTRRVAIVHSYNFHSNVFAIPAARLARTPVVLASIRDTGSHLSPAKRWVHRQVCRLADRVLVNADAIRRQLLSEGYADSKIRVIHNGIDLDRFADLDQRGGPSLRGELGLPDGCPLIVLLARLDPVKRVEDFVDAAALVAAQDAKARFLVIGDDIVAGNRPGSRESDYRRQLTNQVDRLGLTGRLIFTGTRLDVTRFLSEVAVSVLPSSSEGLSNTILESMAAGIPVVATAVGGTPELVDDGVTGFLVPPREPAALAGAILRLLEQPDLARRLGRAGRDKVHRKFGLHRMVAETERLYGQLLEAELRRSHNRERHTIATPGRLPVDLVVHDGRIAVDIVDDIARFAALRDEWTELLSDSRANCLFLTWEWLFTWWTHFGQPLKLSIVTVRSGGRLVGVAPFAVQPPRVSHLWTLMPLEFLGRGSVGSDYLDVIVRSGYEDVAVRALADYLAARNVALGLAQLHQEGAAALDLARRLETNLWRVTSAVTDVCPFIDLRQHTWPTYLQSVGPALRYNFRRRMRNLEKLGEVRFECAETEAEVQKGFDQLVDFHNRRWTDLGGSQAFHEPALIAFHKDFTGLALARGWLRLLTLRVGTRPVSLLYCFRYGNSFLGYQSGFDVEYRKRSVGLVSVGLAIRSAIEEGVSEYDFLHGNEEYKFHWSNQTRQLRRLDLFPGHLRGVVGHRSFLAHGSARRIVKRVVQRTLGAETSGGTAERPETP
jgi:L-malate glycosyltransferase